MKTLIAFIVSALALMALLVFSPAFAQAAQAVAPPTFHIDFTPLIPVINGLIEAVAGVLSASVPVIVAYFVMWLRNHGIAVTQAGQKVIADRISATIQNGLKYATSGADDGVKKLTISVSNPTVAAAANYAIVQSPDLLKKAGIDVTTEEGQQALVRRITAEAMPTPPALAPTTIVNVTSETPAEVGKS